jgi:hypothetical protein
MATYPQQPHMTVEEYFELCRKNPDIRYEYIDGQAVMLAGGSLNHSRIAKNIIIALETFLPAKACQSFTSDAALKFHQDLMPCQMLLSPVMNETTKTMIIFYTHVLFLKFFPQAQKRLTEDENLPSIRNSRSFRNMSLSTHRSR